MKWILGILGILVFVYGLHIFSVSTTIMHQIYGAIIYLIAAILFSGAVIVDSLGVITKKLEKMDKN